MRFLTWLSSLEGVRFASFGLAERMIFSQPQSHPRKHMSDHGPHVMIQCMCTHSVPSNLKCTTVPDGFESSAPNLVRNAITRLTMVV